MSATQPIADVTRYDEVEGYCGRLSYRPGDEVTLHVASRSPLFDVEVYRWGAEHELLWTQRNVEGIDHPVPADADANGCGWPVAVRFTVPSDWRSGFFHVVLRAHDAPEGRAVGHAQFVLRPAARAARALLVIATNTYNAYNNWGGFSLYTGGSAVCFDRPFGRGMISRPHTERDDRKSRTRYTGEDHDIDGLIYQAYRGALDYPGYIGSSGWFTYERRFVEWAEREGIELDYAVSSDLELEPDAADGYSLVLCVGHDEYWSLGQRNTIERFVQGGGNLATFSGNTMFWQVRLEPLADQPGRRMVCHKYSAHLTDPVMGTPGEHTMSGMWADPVVGKPETSILGAGSAWGLYSRFGQATPRGSGAFTVYRDGHWMFEGTGLRYGDLLGLDAGVVGYESVGCRLTFDDWQLPIAAGGDGTPAQMEVVAFTPASNLQVGEYPKSIAANDDQGDLEFVATRLFGRLDADSIARIRHGNAVMLTCRPFADVGAGEVVTIGSTDWVYGLGDPMVAQVTRNVIRRFISTPSAFDTVTFLHGSSMPNRFMLAPLTNQQSHADGSLSDDEIHWLTMRAQGGFGLTMTAAAHVQAVGQGFPGQLGIFSDDHLPGLERMAAVLNASGTVSYAQLHHAGNRAPSDVTGMQPVCPSDDEATGARALTLEEVHELRDAFIAAAVRSERAGFHGVELHGAHGYVLCQFLSAEINHRNDEYGGSLENRSRLLFEIVDGIRSACSPDLALAVRLSPERFGMRTGEIVEVFERLVQGGKVDLIDMSLWDFNRTTDQPGFDDRTLLEVFAALPRGDVRLGVAGKIHTPADVQRVLDAGVDIPVLGRVAILHHDYPQRMQADPAFEPRRAPVTREVLQSEGVSASFVDYLAGTFRFVAD